MKRWTRVPGEAGGQGLWASGNAKASLELISQQARPPNPEEWLRTKAYN